MHGANGGNVVISTPSTGTSTSLPRINLPSNIQNNMPNKPFTLKFKSARVKVCQSCRKSFDDPNDTMGLVVARAERRLVSNISTGLQFLGKESNSHYHHQNLHQTSN